MTFRLSSFGILLALTLGGSFLPTSGVYAGEKQRGRPIEFSDRKTDEVTTNLNQMGSQKNGLRQLEDDLGKPFQTFSPKSSLDGIFTPPMRPSGGPVIPSKRAKELIERQKNWVFMNPDDLSGGLTEEEIFKLRKYDKDGQEKKETSALERFMERQQADRNPSAKKGDSKESDLTTSFKRKQKSNEDDTGLPEGIRESEKDLKKLFESDSTSSLSPISPANSVVDIFGLGTSAATATTKENPNLATYRQLLESHVSPIPTDPFSSIPGALPATSIDSLSSRRDSFAPGATLGTLGLPTPSGLPDMKSFNPAPPTHVDAPRIAPPTPTFAVPQRKFQ